MIEGPRLFRRSTTVQSKEGVIGLEITYTEKPGQTEGQFFTLSGLAAMKKEIRREALEEAAKFIRGRCYPCDDPGSQWSCVMCHAEGLIAIAGKG